MSFRVVGIIVIFVSLSIALPGLAQAQQPAPQDAAQQPASTQSQNSQPKSKDESTAQKKTTAQEQKEKTLEKKEESQRILGIYPQFSVTSRKNAPPLTPGGKFHLFYKSALDPFEFALAGFQAGLDQAEDEFPAFGEGAKGFAKRYAADFGDQASAGFWSNFFYPVLLKEDPRYFRLGEGTFRHRLLYSLAQEFICHKDKGGRTFNFSNALGAFSAGTLSNAYHPPGDRGVGLTVRGASLALVYGSAGGVLSEFWPDISARIARRHKKQAIPGTTGQ